jgi:hypothetical protein
VERTKSLHALPLGDTPSMELYPSKEDPIGQLLPCNAVLGAFILQGDMYTKSDEWTLIENLKKNKGELTNARDNRTKPEIAAFSHGGA